MAMLVHSALKIIGRRGYAMLIDNGIELTQRFASRVDGLDDFELISEPELNILTYRWVPAEVQALLRQGDAQQCHAINEVLSRITRTIQKTQREHGKAFVSRTRLTPDRYNGQLITVFRVVLANPLTTDEVLQLVIDEQREIVQSMAGSEDMAELHRLMQSTIL
jgi:glutamate decarboxylase